MIMEGSDLARYLRPSKLDQIRERSAERARLRVDLLSNINDDCQYLLAEIDRLEGLMAHSHWQRIYDWTQPIVDEPVLLQLQSGDGVLSYDVGAWRANRSWAHTRSGHVQLIARIRPPPCDWRNHSSFAGSR
jgi:hypothetical protein